MADYPPAEERRGTARIPCSFKVSFFPVALLQSAPAQARVRDLSARGIGLITSLPLARGSFIVVDMESAVGTSLKHPARVVRLVPVERNAWLLGCVFLRELTTADLKALLS
jgi:hypothetical protein